MVLPANGLCTLVVSPARPMYRRNVLLRSQFVAQENQLALGVSCNQELVARATKSQRVARPKYLGDQIRRR